MDSEQFQKLFLRANGMVAKTNAQRQADLKAKRQASGFVQVTNLWSHPDDVQQIRNAAAKLVKKRETSKKLLASGVF